TSRRGAWRTRSRCCNQAAANTSIRSSSICSSARSTKCSTSGSGSKTTTATRPDARTSVELVGVVHADDPLARALFLEQLHRFDGVARGGLGLQARERDRFARLFAPTVGA